MKPPAVIAILAILYMAVETHHFGWNALPASDAEVIADGIGLVLTALAVLAWKGETA